MPDGAPKIVVRGLRKAFGSKEVLRGIDLEIAKGASLVIIGGSGTGKSVLLKCMLGLVQPDAGEIFINGVDILRLSAFERAKKTREIGMLFQASALFDSLKVWENVGFRLIYGEGKSRRIAHEKSIECLAQVGLPPEVGDLAPSALSGGMQKRVALARAIASDAKILFFDEPTTGLDPITADVINRLIIERVKAIGATAVSITHDMRSARRIADDVAMIHEGRIVWRGPADDIEQSGNPYVDQFVNGRAEGPIKMAMKSA